MFEFITVVQSEPSYFDEHVNAKLQAGWILQGTPQIVFCGEEDGCDKLKFMQCFIRPSQGKGANDG